DALLGARCGGRQGWLLAGSRRPGSAPMVVSTTVMVDPVSCRFKHHVRRDVPMTPRTEDGGMTARHSELGLTRRAFLVASGLAGATALAACTAGGGDPSPSPTATPTPPDTPLPEAAWQSRLVSDDGD